MPDILLIQPPIRDFYLTAKRTIPQGLAAVGTALAASGFSVEILDALAVSKSGIIDRPPEMAYLDPYYGRADYSPFALFHHFRHYGYSYEHIGNRVRKSGAFLVGVTSLFTAYAEEAMETARIARKNLPGAHIVLGGHHPTALPAAVMESDSVDFIIRGEGEEAFPELARRLRDGKPVDSVPGIVFRKKEAGLHISEPAFVDDPDAFPPPDADLIRTRFYRRKRKESAVVVASRGCPMKCTYCCVGHTVPYRRRSVVSVLKELEKAVWERDAGFIDFEDENLSLNRSWFMELLAGIHERFGESPPELRAMNGLYAPTLDAEVIAAMKSAGFRTLNLSLGTSSGEGLKRFRRPDIVDAVDRAVSAAEEMGMDSVCYIIAGAPDRNATDSVDDLLWLAGRKTLAGVSVYYPAPGSPDYRRCRNLGILPDRFSLMRASVIPVPHITSRLETVTILRLGRILNFIKLLEADHQKLPVPAPLPASSRIDSKDRQAAGKLLVSAFLKDGRIYGVSREGEAYAHETALHLTKRFISGLDGRHGPLLRKRARGHGPLLRKLQ